MTIQECKLIKILNKITRKSESPFFYDSNDFSIHLDENEDSKIACGNLSREINGLIKSLWDKGFIESVPTYGIDKDRYCLTHKGIHHLQFSAEEKTKFIVRSVIIPVVVAAITAFFTVYIRGQL